MNVINFKDKTEFYWPECEHIIKSNDDVDCPYCRIAELEAKLERVRGLFDMDVWQLDNVYTRTLKKAQREEQNET